VSSVSSVSTIALPASILGPVKLIKPFLRQA
jgi:hypothetical protein